MKLITPKFEIINQNNTLNGIYQQIELAGRTCYKSENNIKYEYKLNGDVIDDLDKEFTVMWCENKFNECNDRVRTDNIVNLYEYQTSSGKQLGVSRLSSTAKAFTQRMIDSKHHAMLEHGTVYLKANADILVSNRNGWEECYIGESYAENKYSKRKLVGDYSYITTNLRVLVENDWLEDLQYLCEPTEHHEKRVSVRFTTQIAISREFNRHRINSMAEESTRYCNYSKDKFSNEFNICIPSHITNIDEMHESKNTPVQDLCLNVADHTDQQYWLPLDYWWFSNIVSEYCYMNMIRLGWTAQQARTIIPLDLKTEFIHTAFVSDWKHFFELRDHQAAHPDARILAQPLHEEFKKLKFI